MIDQLKRIVDGVSHYLVGIAVAGLGLLILTLRARGRKIHKLQVQLLEQQLDAKEQSADEAVTAAAAKYRAAKEAYEEAGGRL